MQFPVIVLFLVFLLIAVRQVGRFRLRIWQIMTAGAVIVLASGRIPAGRALESINFDVILFLFGMFVVGEALEESGYLARLSYHIFRRARSVDSLLILILFGMGFLSALLMNDTLAIIGTPVVLHLARRHRVSPKLLLLALAFAITTGSVMSPIGNPQNLLIAIHSDMKNPFLTFFARLFLPTAVNLFLAFCLLKYYYRDQFHDDPLNHLDEPIRDPRLARLSQLALVLIVLLVGAKILTFFFPVPFRFRLTYIALFSALPVILFSPQRFQILKKIDWPTLLFFASMFILMQSVWDTGFFQGIIRNLNLSITNILVILAVSVVLSQLISNVPLVALYLPLLFQAGASTEQMVALGAGSTLAGNTLILGAASNVIIIQNAETKFGETLTFWEFMKIGVPLTALNILVCWLFLYLI
ncbi:MAG: anion transporter [bacterium]|nr:anion transporter [bacterium]